MNQNTQYFGIPSITDVRRIKYLLIDNLCTENLTTNMRFYGLKKVIGIIDSWFKAAGFLFPIRQVIFA